MSNPDDAYRAAPDLVPGLLEAARIADERGRAYDAFLDAATDASTANSLTSHAAEAFAMADMLRAKAKEITNANR